MEKNNIDEDFNLNKQNKDIDVSEVEIEKEMKKISEKIKSESDSETYMSQNFFKSMKLNIPKKIKKNSFFAKLIHSIFSFFLIIQAIVFFFVLVVFITSLPDFNTSETPRQLLIFLSILFFSIIIFWLMKDIIQRKYIS